MDNQKLTVGPNQLDNPTLGDFLRRCRESKRLSRAEAAEKAGLSSEYLRLIELGERSPAKGSFINLLNLYDMVSQVDNNRVIPEDSGFDITFTSRIQESRGKQTFNRNEIVGRVMKLLVTANDETIQSVYQQLRKES